MGRPSHRRAHVHPHMDHVRGDSHMGTRVRAHVDGVVMWVHTWITTLMMWWMMWVHAIALYIAE